ncbi:MAG TPA: hypothetical protein VHO50_05055 [Bacteroidales bacterium]|nr:hypothetical protein [Bacteroidales bacterium]
MSIVKETRIDLTITRDDLLRLSEYHNSSCISIFMPTHRGGVETLKGLDSLNLKNKEKHIRNMLGQQGVASRDIDNLLKPVIDLINDNVFWRHQAGGLALFVAEDIFEKYIIPVNFEEFTYLSSEFYLKPLIPLFNYTGTFFLLTLKKDGAKLFQGNKFNIDEINVENIIPARIEDSVGYDFEQKQLQFRTMPGGNKPGSFHGHGEHEADEKKELLTYFREIDRGIMSFLHNKEESPLLICCIDYYFPIYKEANTNKNLFVDYISINPADLDIRELHERSWELLAPYFDMEIAVRKEKFLIGFERGKSSSDIREIVPASVAGKIDTLFVEKNAELFGIYDPLNGNVIIQDEHTMANVSLMNLSAKKVFEQGGLVYLVEKHELPDGSSDINAIFRY